MATPERAADLKAMLKNPPDMEAVARLSKDPLDNSMMRTTCVATRLSGGHANNALPQLATANVNCRVLPGASIDAIKQTIIDTLADPKITVSLVKDAHPSQPAMLRADVLNAVESLTKEMF